MDTELQELERQIKKKKTEIMNLELLMFGLTYDKQQLLRQAKGVLKIRYGNYPYECFSVCFLHDILSQILEALYNGYIPKVELADRRRGWTDWGDYFEQPFFEYMQTVERFPVYEMDKRLVTLWGPTYGFFREPRYMELTCRLYRDWVIPNNKVYQYIQREKQELFDGKSVLGVLCRGTDFITRKPGGHPVQPDIDVLIRETERMLVQLDCDYVYVASEEKQMVNHFKAAFPGCVLENRRHYCDEKYYEMADVDINATVAGALYCDEENYYQRGLEYISSMMLLSKCKGLVAGDCGGSEFALCMNDRKYEAYHIFDLGMY